MHLAAIRTFLAAAECGSFAGAAERVNASPSTVTERIKQLEHRLSARLFERDKGGCRLTAAGRKFLAPAGQAVRALDLARHDVGLPERFTRTVAIGGQYVLWNEAAMGWLAGARSTFADLAIRASAGSSVRLNRDLAEGFLDLAFLYDPVFGKEIAAQPLFTDDLVLVTGGDPACWREDYVRIEWGRGLGAQIASHLDLIPETGLTLDLGARAADWLVSQRMAGYMPRRAVALLLDAGSLSLATEAPSFEFPAYLCWRRDVDPDLAAEIAAGLEQAFLCE